MDSYNKQQYNWIIGYNTQAERKHILKTCREHNAIATREEQAGDENVGEELVYISETCFTKPYKKGVLAGMSKAITFGHGGGKCPTRIFFVNRHLTITEYTKAISNRIRFPIVPAIDDDSGKYIYIRQEEIKQIEQMYKFKVQQIFESIKANSDNHDDDVCPTCCQGDYKKYMPCSLPPDCPGCYKWVCTRCGILDDLNDAEANGYYCVHCYRPELIHIDGDIHGDSDDDSKLETIDYNGLDFIP